MVRILLLIMTLLLAYSASADAGWLDDKLKQAAESVGDRLINDASDKAYEGAKDSVGPGDNEMNSETSGQYESGEAAELEEGSEESAEYGAESDLEEMAEPSWADSGYGQKNKKKRKAGPPRTDLHLTAEMIMSDPENSPEPVKGMIYLDGAKSRTEFDDLGGNSMGVIVTGIDPADKVYVLLHKEETYMESTSGETDSFSFESGKPCEGYRKAEDLGSTKLNGRSVAKWRCSEPEDPEDAEEAQRIVTLWVDDKLEIPYAWRRETGKATGSW